jgi:hypothetical protein
MKKLLLTITTSILFLSTILAQNTNNSIPQTPGETSPKPFVVSNEIRDVTIT